MSAPPRTPPRTPPSTSATRHRAVEPPGWPRPRGYANGIVAEGPVLYVAGQVAFEEGKIARRELAEQFGVALDNVLAVVGAAGGAPEDIVRMTVYVTDLPAYRSSLAEIGEAWRARLGRHFPAMALVGVAGLVEPDALVEIEATAVLSPPAEGGA